MAHYSWKSWINEMTIDEEGVAKIKGRNPTDHNTIIINLDIKNIDRTQVCRRITWNIRAPEEKWADFKNEIGKKLVKVHDILSDGDKSINERYNKWMKQIEEAAWKTIGKTTFKEQKTEKFSDTVNEMRRQKRPLKEQIQMEKNTDKKQVLIQKYKDLQGEINNLVISERTIKIQQKFEKISQDKSRKSFWREKREVSRNYMQENMIVKDD